MSTMIDLTYKLHNARKKGGRHTQAEGYHSRKKKAGRAE